MEEFAALLKQKYTNAKQVNKEKGLGMMKLPWGGVIKPGIVWHFEMPSPTNRLNIHSFSALFLPQLRHHLSSVSQVALALDSALLVLGLPPPDPLPAATSVRSDRFASSAQSYQPHHFPPPQPSRTDLVYLAKFEHFLIASFQLFSGSFA